MSHIRKAPALSNRGRRHVTCMIPKRSAAIDGKRTSVSVERDFWDGLDEIAKLRCSTIGDLLAEIILSTTEAPNLASAVRLYVLNFYIAKCDHRAWPT